jgi:hypothetical protein
VWYEKYWPITNWKKAHASYDHGETLWDPEMVRRMNAVAKAIAMDVYRPEGGGNYTAVCFDGIIRTFTSPKFDPRRQILEISPVHALELSQNIVPPGTIKHAWEVIPEGTFISNDPRHLQSFSITVNDIPRHITEKECVGMEGWDPWSKWIQEWKTGKWTRYAWWLKGLIYKHGEKLKYVDQIICFALGSLQKNIEWIDEDTGIPGYKEFPRVFIQHMVAVTIRDTIHEILEREPQAGEDQPRKTIRILSQDPAYCRNCSKVLLKHLQIETTRDFQGMVDVADQDKNSFVISMSATNNIVSMICDVTKPFRGPLAMLCDEIELQQRSWSGAHISGAPWLRWDEWNGSDPRNSAIYPYGDQTTKNMALYVKGCDSEYFGDFTEKVGIHARDFVPAHHEGVMDIKRKRNAFGVKHDDHNPGLVIPDGAKGDKIYLDKYGTEYKNDLANATRLWSKVYSSYFGDLQLYVRKE